MTEYLRQEHGREAPPRCQKQRRTGHHTDAKRYESTLGPEDVQQFSAWNLKQHCGARAIDLAQGALGSTTGPRLCPTDSLGSEPRVLALREREREPLQHLPW
jgi:hypothetical protein